MFEGLELVILYRHRKRVCRSSIKLYLLTVSHSLFISYGHPSVLSRTSGLKISNRSNLHFAPVSLPSHLMSCSSTLLFFLLLQLTLTYTSLFLNTLKSHICYISFPPSLIYKLTYHGIFSGIVPARPFLWY